MNAFAVLTRKELGAALMSPIAYTVAAVFLLVLGYTFSLTLFATKVANLNYIFHQMYVLSILITPVVTMRAFSILPQTSLTRERSILTRSKSPC